LNPARTVAKGDLLVRLDTSSEEAQLRAAEAQVELARLNAERTRKLRADNTVSQSELDAGGGDLETKPGQRRRHPRDD
jgi:membrane fusion protein (multidrug efflux system)